MGIRGITPEPTTPTEGIRLNFNEPSAMAQRTYNSPSQWGQITNSQLPMLSMLNQYPTMQKPTLNTQSSGVNRFLGLLNNTQP